MNVGKKDMISFIHCRYVIVKCGKSALMTHLVLTKRVAAISDRLKQFTDNIWEYCLSYTHFHHSREVSKNDLLFHSFVVSFSPFTHDTHASIRQYLLHSCQGTMECSLNPQIPNSKGDAGHVEVLSKKCGTLEEVVTHTGLPVDHHAQTATQFQVIELLYKHSV